MSSTPTQFEVFSKPSCMQCKMTKRYLEKHDLPFEEYEAADHMEALKAQGIQSAPGVFAYRDREFLGAWGGFRPDLMEAAAKGEGRQTA